MLNFMKKKDKQVGKEVMPVLVEAVGEEASMAK
jgi:hypothetical protein